MAVKKFQLLLHIHVSIEIDKAVGRMIVLSVEIQKFLIAEIRNIYRISAGLTAIGGMRIQRVHDLPLKHIIRRRKCSLHLIVDHTVDLQFFLVTFQLIMPAFLPENGFVFINIRVKYGIQIDMHQVMEILVIAACHRVYGLIRISHGI